MPTPVKGVEAVPPHLQRIVDDAHRNPYEAFASAAVALLFHDQLQTDNPAMREAK